MMKCHDERIARERNIGRAGRRFLDTFRGPRYLLAPLAPLLGAGRECAMPLYEYECTKCHHRFEVIQKFSDAPRDECPVCRAPVRKLVSAPAIRFKGKGWYVTDYGRKPEAPEARKEDPKPAEGKVQKGKPDSPAPAGSGGKDGKKD